ncbi:MAG TPA: TadE/TadG family type IV pilus assembly protein [Pirellulales bacterium]|nr:TadE/TadG family type IV pilus assembly protein [Pirellulales bacterium]
MRHRPTHARRGAAAVELALVSPLLAFLFAVTVDFARAFNVSQTVENCARNGAVYAADPKAAANNLYSNVSDAALASAGNLSPSPTVTSSTGTDANGNACVTVTVSYPFITFLNFMGSSSTTITRSVQARKAIQ